MKENILKEYGDKLLIALAIVILLTVLVRLGINGAFSRFWAPSLVFTHWDADPQRDVLLAVIDEFESLHEGMRVSLVTRPYEELRRELFNAGENSSFGDIISIDPLWRPELSEMGVIVNQQIDEPRTGQAIISFINVLYYNIDILRDVGFTRPPKSRDEFLRYARVLTRAGAHHGLVLGADSSRGMYDNIYPWIWAAGAELVNNGRPAVNSQPLVNSLAFLATLNREGLIAPGAFTSSELQKLEDFSQGQAAFMIAPASKIGFVRERMGDEAFSVTSVPIPDNYIGRSLFASSGWTLGINANSANREAARLFADFLAEKASVFSDLAKAVPGNGIPLYSQDIFHTKLWDIAIVAEAERDFFGMPWSELDAIFREELLFLFDGNSSPAEAAAIIQRRWEWAMSNW
ncbi:MAG: extracellular solute-binding protein [Treponema sp.]|nr:extracellular solute-binding protein [Treponema sp.]